MPVLMPTPKELRSMSAAQREKARRALWRIIAETDRQVEHDLRRVDDARVYGEYIRATARELEKYTRHDPPHVIALRRRTALEAMK